MLSIVESATSVHRAGVLEIIHVTSTFAVLHIPHASTEIPEDTRAAFCVSDEELDLELLRMTDHYTDELFNIGSGVALTVAFPVSRLLVDPERFLDDAAEPMARKGRGVLYTRTSHGAPLRAPVSPVERTRLLDRYYHPHHARLTQAVESVLAERESCLVVDCHSFGSAPRPYEWDQSLDRPQICLGTDAFHSPPSLVEAARGIFEAAGFTVALDRPFGGALVPMAHYGKDRRVLALMVEVNRGLYMDEQTGARGEACDSIRLRLQDAVRQVIAFAATLCAQSPRG